MSGQGSVPEVSERRPDFISEAAIERQADRIVSEFTPHLIEGIEFFAGAYAIELSDIEADDPLRSWLLATRTSRYNAVYAISRREAATSLDFVKENADSINEAGRLMDEQNGATQIINYAFHSFIRAFADTPGREVKIEGKSIPPSAIQAQDENTIVIRQAELLESDPSASFDREGQIYDWHDLAHMVAASSSRGAFGVKYHQGLGDLDRYYRALTEGEGMKDASGPLFSDGLLFSQLSKPILEFYEAQTHNGLPMYNYDEIQALITDKLFQYLGGKQALWHPGIEQEIRADRPIDPLELAVCIQNKRYERRASEVEPSVFVRGTPDGSRGDPDKDPLYDLERSERVGYVAHSEDRLYFEARNVTRHRAHEDALGRFAVHMLQIKRLELEQATSSADRLTIIEDIQLLEASVDFFRLSDLRRAQEHNLYKVVDNVIESRIKRGAYSEPSRV